MNTRSAISYLYQLISCRKIDFFIACCFVTVLALVELPLPIFMAILIDNLLPSGDITNLIILGIFLFGVRASASVFQIMQNYLISRIINTFTATLRKNMFYKMIRLPYEKYLNTEANGMATRFSQDVDRVSEFAQHTIHFLIRPVLSFIFIISLMLFWSPPLALYCLIIVPIITLITRVIRIKMEKYSRKQRSLTEKLETIANESLSNIKVLRAFTAEDQINQKIDYEIEQLEQTGVQLQLYTELANRSIEFIKTINNIGFIFIAAFLVFKGELTIGGFVALQTMAEGVRSPIAQMMFYIINFKSKTIALERTWDVVYHKQEQENENLTQISLQEPMLSFKNINYQINEKIILDNVNFDVQPGHMVALVGPSGAGKTTLANLLLRLIEPTSGEIFIDETPLSTIDVYSHRKNLGVVFQESILFNQTIKYNLRIGKPMATDDEIWQALKVANAYDFVKGLPFQLDTRIGVNGIKLSGGQQQRLSIARAILADPKILILDEATSSLDSVSEMEIKIGLDNAMKGRTSLVIAHRLSTIANADQIIVLEDGKITEMGNHQTLINQESGLYRQLYQTQTDGLIQFSSKK